MCALPLYIRLWFWLFLWLLGSTTVSERVAAAQGSLPQPLPLAPGAEALGRGGAFVAKADSPLALEYNVAGPAQLRGTQVLLDASLFLPEARLRTCRPWSQEALRPRYGGLLALTTERSRAAGAVYVTARAGFLFERLLPYSGPWGAHSRSYSLSGTRGWESTPGGARCGSARAT